MNENGDFSNCRDAETLPKLPFKRLKYALDQIVKTAIPLHVEFLNKTSENIENHKENHRIRELRLEQIEASKAVQLLKADLYELEQLNLQVKDDDQELFHRTIKGPLKDAVEVLSNFMTAHADILGPIPAIEPEDYVSQTEFPSIVCDMNKESDDVLQEQQLQLQMEEKNLVTAKANATSWSFLKKEMVEIHSLICQFSSLVFGQKEKIDTIQGNIEETAENVQAGAQFLKKARLLKAATFPITGAILGGLILGPVGALAGFKIMGSAACLAGGSAMGYGLGVKMKKKQEEAICDLEMKALTYPSESNSVSNPELNVTNHIKDS